MSNFNYHDAHDYASWHKINHEYTPISYIASQITYDMLLALMEFLYPRFIVVDDCIFVEWKYSDTLYQQWKNVTGITNTEIEKVINHIHIMGIMPFLSGRNTTNVRMIAELVRQSWLAMLRTQYPTIDATAAIYDSEIPGDIEITIFQQRTELQRQA